MERTSLHYRLFYSISNPDFLKILSDFKQKKIKRIEKWLRIDGYNET